MILYDRVFRGIMRLFSLKEMVRFGEVLFENDEAWSKDKRTSE